MASSSSIFEEPAMEDVASLPLRLGMDLAEDAQAQDDQSRSRSRSPVTWRASLFGDLGVQPLIDMTEEHEEHEDNVTAWRQIFGEGEAGLAADDVTGGRLLTCKELKNKIKGTIIGSTEYDLLTDHLPPGPRTLKEFGTHAQRCLDKTFAGKGGLQRQARCMGICEKGLIVTTDYSGHQGPECVLRMQQQGLKRYLKKHNQLHT